MKGNDMKKKYIAVIFAVLVLLLTSCNAGNVKTVKTREEVKQMAEEFYGDLLKADNVMMSAYRDEVLVNEFTRDGDRMYVNNTEAGYDYYLFQENGKKYLISDDRTLFEDESMYDLSADTIRMTLDFAVLAYLDADVEGLTYTATKKGDQELVVTIEGSDEGNAFTITSTGTKESGSLQSLLSEIRSGENGYQSEYRFAYDKHVELPEYTVIKTYDDLPHVESPYQTYGEIIEQLGEEEALFYCFYDTQLLVIGEKDGRHYQFSTVVDQETYDAFNDLDFMDDDYDQKVYDLLSDIPIEDCVDFTDELLSQGELDSYAGKTVRNLIDEGYEANGWSFWEENNFVFVMKDGMTYRLEVELPEGFDPDSEFEYEDLYGFNIRKMTFESPEYSILPMN